MPCCVALAVLAVVTGCTLRPRVSDEVGASVTGLPPLFRQVSGGEKDKLTVLWPFYHETRSADRDRTRLFPIYYRHTLRHEGGADDTDWVLLPLLFGGSDPKEGDYFLFFPFWGESRGFLSRGLLDAEVTRFRFFPLYLDKEIGEYHSTHLLWPLVSWGSGGGKSDFRILPFYSEREEVGKSWSRAVMWPLVSWGEDHLDSLHPVENVLVLPFYGHSLSEKSYIRSYLPPFFSFAGNEAGFRDTELFWPIYRSMEAPDGSSAFRLWPIHGEVRAGNTEEDFWLWPFIWNTRYVMPLGRMDSVKLVPFYRNTTYYSDPEGTEPDRGRDVQVWPLFRRQRDRVGPIEFKLPAPVPFAAWDEFEANYDWLWTIFR